MQSVDVSPELIRWARDRSNLSVDYLISHFPRYLDWEAGTGQPTFKQLQQFSRLTYTPFGYFSLSAPPDEKLPIRDFRTISDSRPRRPSPSLLETVQTMQRRQNWLRDELIDQGVDRLGFVGSVKRRSAATAVAAKIRETLGIGKGWASTFTSWEKALHDFRDRIEAAGIVVVKNGVVGNDTHRKLDPSEFRGFVLCDDYAPLIFVNGRDSKSAQMFTLAHELAHVWLGRDGVFDLANLQPATDKIERQCNEIAAELLVPAEELLNLTQKNAQPSTLIYSISTFFRVSPIVAARRALDLQLISRDTFFAFYSSHETAVNEEEDGTTGGNFYNTQYSRLGKRFSIAVIRAAKEGRLLYRDAYQLTGLHGRVFDNYATQIESGMSE